MMWDDQFWIMLLNHDFMENLSKKSKLLMRKQPVGH